MTAAAISGCAKGTPEQQIVDDAASALGGRDRVLAVKTLVIEGEGIERQPRPGHDARSDRAEVRAVRLQAIDRRGGRPGADRADAHTELRLLPGAGAAEAGARRRRRRRVQRGAERQRDARLERGGAAIGERISFTTRSRLSARRSTPRPGSRILAPPATSASSTSRPPMDSPSRWRSTAPPSCRRGSCRCPTTPTWVTSPSKPASPTIRTSAA